MKAPGRLVIRAHAPARRWLTLAVMVGLTALGLWLTYELGRRSAGYDSSIAAQERDRLQERIGALERTEKELRVQIAAAEETRLAQVRERTEVGKTIGELQAQVARLSQDLEFYRGMVTQQMPRSTGLRVQQFRIAAVTGQQGGYTLRFTVNRTTSAEQSYSGTLLLSIDGTRGGSAASVDLGSMTTPRATSLPLNFRYFTTIEQAITLPEGFSPQSVTIEIRTAKSGVAPYRQSFIWNVENGA